MLSFLLLSMRDRYLLVISLARKRELPKTKAAVVVVVEHFHPSSEAIATSMAMAMAMAISIVLLSTCFLLMLLQTLHLPHSEHSSLWGSNQSSSKTLSTLCSKQSGLFTVTTQLGWQPSQLRVQGLLHQNFS